MNGISRSAANSSSEIATASSMPAPSKAEGIAWCSVYILTSIFIVAGNLLTIVLFVLNKNLRKKSFFLIINMAFADLMLGVLSLPSFIFLIGNNTLQLWTARMSMPLEGFLATCDSILMIASLTSAAFISGERVYAIYWPFKYRTLTVRAYRIIIFTVWTLSFLHAALYVPLTLLGFDKYPRYVLASYLFTLTIIISCANVSICRKFQRGSGVSQQQNRAWQNKRLTKTLLFVSILALLSWLPLASLIGLSTVGLLVPWRYFLLAIVINYSNSVVNPVVYALRIPELRGALVSCCFGRQALINIIDSKSRNNKNVGLTPASRLRTLRTEPIELQLAFQQEVVETKL